MEKETMVASSAWMKNSLGDPRRGGSIVGQYMSHFKPVNIHHKPSGFMNMPCGGTILTSAFCYGGGNYANFRDMRNWNFSKDNNFFECWYQGAKQSVLEDPWGFAKLCIDGVNSLLGGNTALQQPQVVAYNPGSYRMPTNSYMPMTYVPTQAPAPQIPMDINTMQFYTNMMFPVMEYNDNMRALS